MKIETKKPTGKITGRGKKLVYPFDKLQIGQCITIEEKDNKTSIIQSAYQYAKRNNITLIRETGKDKIIRIYRTR